MANFVYMMCAFGAVDFEGNTYYAKSPRKSSELLVDSRRLVRAPVGTGVLRRVLRRWCHRRHLEGA